MVENFEREYRSLKKSGRRPVVMGIYGSFHCDMQNPNAMACRLHSDLGDILSTRDMTLAFLAGRTNFYRMGSGYLPRRRRLSLCAQRQSLSAAHPRAARGLCALLDPPLSKRLPPGRALCRLCRFPGRRRDARVFDASPSGDLRAAAFDGRRGRDLRRRGHRPGRAPFPFVIMLKTCRPHVFLVPPAINRVASVLLSANAWDGAFVRHTLSLKRFICSKGFTPNRMPPPAAKPGTRPGFGSVLAVMPGRPGSPCGRRGWPPSPR